MMLKLANAIGVRDLTEPTGAEGVRWVWRAKPNGGGIVERDARALATHLGLSV